MARAGHLPAQPLHGSAGEPPALLPAQGPLCRADAPALGRAPRSRTGGSGWRVGADHRTPTRRSPVVHGAHPRAPDRPVRGSGGERGIPAAAFRARPSPPRASADRAAGSQLRPRGRGFGGWVPTTGHPPAGPTGLARTPGETRSAGRPSATRTEAGAHRPNQPVRWRPRRSAPSSRAAGRVGGREGRSGAAVAEPTGECRSRNGGGSAGDHAGDGLRRAPRPAPGDHAGDGLASRAPAPAGAAGRAPACAAGCRPRHR